jgi:hypothetical protein
MFDNDADALYLDAPAVAEEFLNQWQKACASCSGVDSAEFLDREFQARLSRKYAEFTGWPIFLGQVDAVARELHKQRVARGWSGPNPGTIEPAVESVIVMLWCNGLRAAERDMASLAFLPVPPLPPDFFDDPGDVEPV